MLLKKPTFALISILTMALCIGANTIIFSLIDAVLLRPLPYPHPDRLVALWTSYPASHGLPDIFSPPNYLDLAARTKTLEAVGSYDNASFTLQGTGAPESLPGLRTSASMGRVLGVAPQIGRWFTPAEDDNGHAVVLLSDALWRSRFGADPHVLGRSLPLNGRSFTVIGVLPPQVGFPSLSTNLYVPISFGPNDRAGRGNVEINVAARMRPGVPLATAEAELHTIAASLAQSYPDADKGIRMGAVPLQDSLVGNVRGLLVVLWAAVAIMLAVGCANVANLLLTHAASRQREFAVRRSLGATNGRLIGQLLTESILLAGIGGVVGLVLALWVTPLVTAQMPAGFPHLHELGMNFSVLVFTLGASLVTGVLFGLAPATGVSRSSLAFTIRQGDDRGGRSIANRQLGRGLVVGEIALVLVLLVGAGLILKSLARLSGVNPGFRAHGLLVWQIFPAPERYPNTAARRAFYSNLLDHVTGISGIRSAAFVSPLPFGPVDITLDGGFRIVGRPDPAPGQVPQTLFARVTPGYFSTMAIPLQRGRDFTDRDTEGSPGVAIVSEMLARRYFGGQNAVGQRVILGRKQPMHLEIVGVVGDVKHNNLRSDVRPELYISVAQFTPIAAGLVVRASEDPGALLPALQRRVWSVDGGLAANLVSPVENLLYTSLAPSRIAAILLAVFAGTALILGLAGIYGVLSYAITQRTREIGIRLALGATPTNVLRMVLGEALSLTGVGLALGFVAALPLSHYLNSLLFGVRPSDPVTYLIALVCVPVAALLAAYTPARRAMSVDPARSLRAD